jgi:heptosyltransferase-1
MNIQGEPEFSTSEAPHAVNRLLIVRLGSMGDVIHALPAVAALRQVFPNATFGWVIEERWAELLCAGGAERKGARSPQRPLADSVHTVDTFRWRQSIFSHHTWQHASAAIKDLRASQYEAAIDFQGAIRSALIARWSGAQLIYGSKHPREAPARMFYKTKVATRGEHVIEQNLSLAEALAQQPLSISPALFPCDPRAEEKIESWLRSQTISDFILLNPGAGWGAKQWPAERYAQVAMELGEIGVMSVVNFGPGEEALAQTVQANSAGAAKAACCSIGELIALTRKASLFIGGDTGPMHLAAAMNIPVVAIFGPTDPARNGPYATRNVVLRSSASAVSYSHRSEPDAGLLQIRPEDVVGAASDLLRNPRA